MTKHLQIASNQRDVWNDQAAYPDSPIYNIGGSFVINGHVEYKILNAAIQQLITENDAFHFLINDNSIVYKQNKQALYDLEFIDFSSHLSPKKEAEQWLENNFKLPFSNKADLPLWHLALVKESEHRYYLLQKYHHVIADGWSTSVVIARTTEIYNALLNKQQIEQKSKPGYFDYIAQEQKYLDSNAYQGDAQYWEKCLPSLPPSLISRRYPISAETILPKAHLYRLKISRDVYNEIDAFAIKNQSTVYHAFLISLTHYYSRIYQHEDIVIGVPSLNRSGARFKDVFGMFVNLSPLILTVSPTESITQLMQHCRKRLRELYRHHRFPLGDINKRLKLLQSGQDTLFDIVFSFEKFEYSSAYGDASITVKQQFSGVARYPLAVTICEFNAQDDDVEIVFEGAENCFTVEDLKCLAEHLMHFLQQALEQAEKTVYELELLTAVDKKLIFESFNQEHTEQTEFHSVIKLFQQQVKKQPQKSILEYRDLNLTYQQLDQVSSQLALHIQKQGGEPGSVIAIYLPRSLEMVIGILAILKTAAAYVPIPHDIPDQRIAYILEQSQASIVLSTTLNQERLSSLKPNIICVDDFPTQQYASDMLSSCTYIKPETSAYIIFTSGSTGTPKGVVIDHQALSLRIKWLQSLFNLKENDRMGQSIPYNFDPSLIEIFLSLTQGCCLVLIPENDYTVEQFAPYIIEKKLTALAMVPSSIRMLLQGLKYRQKTSLRIACCGGERLEPNLAKQFLQKTQAQLYNAYGPTEATIIASTWEYSESFSDKNLPIGKPADNTQIYITDKHLNILPVNEVGEIVITGSTLAKGYINQPSLTQKVFPVWSVNQTPVYKTGDCGYLGHDGLLYFSGRLDRQVKINGYRIELGEIEFVLQQHGRVILAAAIVYVMGGQKIIIAYIETRVKQSETLTKELSFLLRQQLPSYMQPQKIIILESIPCNTSGKIDYALLPVPEKETTHNSKEAARNPMEAELLKLWKKTLKQKKISVFDNFFELGGDSLSAVSLMVALEELTATRYPISFLLNHPNVAEQAIALDKINLDNLKQVRIRLSQHENTPHVYIAASGQGDFLRFFSLANALGHHCSVTMLQPPETKKQTVSIHEIAQSYATCILSHNETKFYIAGFSIGGITALETARILVEKEMPPKGLILLDSIYPRWPLQSPLLFKGIRKVVNFLALNKKTINHRKLGAMLNDPGIKVQLAALSKHKIQTVELPVDLVLTQGMWMFRPLLFSTWTKLFNKHLFRHKITGLHGEMFQEPHLQQLAAVIKKTVNIKKL